MRKISTHQKRFLSMIMTLFMLVATVFGGSVPVVHAEDASDESCVDYTFDASRKTWGLDFGNELDAWGRWQSFTMPEEGTLKSADVWLIKRADESGGTSDIKASLYAMEGGVPSTQIGGEVIVKGSDVTDKGITTINFSDVGKLEEGKQYALFLTMDTLTTSFEKTNGKYDWVSNKTTVVASGDVAGKHNGRGFAAETTVGTMYLKVTYEKIKAGAIDYSHDASGKRSGFDFGSSLDAYSRWQSFTMPEDGNLNSVEVWLIKRTDEGGNTADLVASVYSMSGGVPDKQIGSVTVAGADVVDKGVTTIDLSSVKGLKKDTQYAVVLTTDPLADNLTKTNGRYDWVSSKNIEAARTEAAGQIGVRGTCDETAVVGTMYLKVNYTPGSSSEGPVGPDLPPVPGGAVPYDITLEVSNQDTLEIGGTTKITATVLDQNGAKITDSKIEFSADSDAVTLNAKDGEAVVTGAKEGVAKISVQSGSAVASVDVYVYDQSKDYTIPTAGMVIKKDTALKPGIYNFGGAQTGITIGADNVKVKADYVKIVNAEEEKFVSDTTTGAYAYQLNAVSGKTSTTWRALWCFPVHLPLSLVLTQKQNIFAVSLRFRFQKMACVHSAICAKQNLSIIGICPMTMKLLFRIP
ncbi:choice-of-anchor R domain-containing protein [Roseburia hominis]